MPKTRKWSDEYVKYGFTAFLDDKGGPDRAQCMTCHFIVCNSNLKPARLRDHQLKHPTTEHEQSLEALQAKRARYEKKGTLPQLGFKPVQKPLLQASYEVAYQCIRAKASHSAPENLIKPCTIRMVELILGTEAAKKMKDVPLSNNVIGGRVEDMSCDILDQIVEEIQASPTRISLQLDESTDVSNLSQLIVYTRYIKDDEIKDEFLFCLAWQTTTKAADVFRLLDEFFQKHQIKWEKVGSVCTDGAPAMLGNKSGFAALVKERVPDIITKHCVLHRHALAVKTLPSHFKEVLSVCVKVVNYIRGRALNHRVFKLFCEEMGSEHQVLLFHTEVRWLSRGKMLARIAELADEIAIFLREYQSNFAENFEDEIFILSLSYLADIFGHLNDLNLSMQGMFANNIDCTKKVEAFKKKISLWKRRIQGGNVGSFPILDEKHGDKTIQPMLVENIVAHLSLLETTMAQYFPMDHSFPEWIQQPFLADMDDDDNLKEELIDLQVNQGCQTKFRTLPLSGFWCDQLVAYPGLAKAALEMIIPFPTTYLCEKAFSTMLQIKTTARNRLQIGLLHDMRVALANTKPRIEKLVAYNIL
ncbi:protein FAM200C-like [Palaemon carinicauda]|uniref:protein FAM200C-like n=1 Tax=Palaemon carinicauda TaxID=392227 RepID=UPI0035B5FE11